MNRNNSRNEKEWQNFMAKLDETHAVELAPYRFKIVLSFDDALPSSVAAARGSWVVWCLQSSYIGCTVSDLRSGLEGIAVLHVSQSDEVSKITILLKDHASFVPEPKPAEVHLQRQILRAISMGTNASIDQKAFATLDDLSDGCFEDLEKLISTALSGKLLRMAWGRLV
jgi:hypothetical protein